MSSYLRWLFKSGFGGIQEEDNDSTSRLNHQPFNLPEYLFNLKPRSRSLDTKTLEATGIKLLQQVSLHPYWCGLKSTAKSNRLKG